MINSVEGYICKVCGQKMDIHGCSEHRQATGHENFLPILLEQEELENED